MSAQSFAEMRIEPRWQLKSTVSVFREGGKDCLGLLVNWSSSGLMISSYQSLQIGDRLRIELVDIVNDDDRRTGSCEVEIMWCQELTPSLFGNGCKVLEGSDMLSTMMHDYCDDEAE